MAFEVRFEWDASGPLFDGMAEHDVEAYCRQIEDAIGEIGVRYIRAYLPTQYMYLGHHGGTPETNPVPHDAGFYQSQIHTERQTEDTLLITDTPVVYGPWLEGVSSKNLIVWPHRRNPPPRRFPGYMTFRVIAQRLEEEAQGIAESILPPYLLEMNS